MPSGVSQSPRANPVVFHFSEVPRGVTSLEAESRWWRSGAGAGMEHRVSTWEDEMFWRQWW